MTEICLLRCNLWLLIVSGFVFQVSEVHLSKFHNLLPSIVSSSSLFLLGTAANVLQSNS